MGYSLSVPMDPHMLVESYSSLADEMGMMVEVDSDDGVSNEKAAAEAGPTTEGDDGAVWCKDCEMWLNGPTQMDEHKIGKKHKKKVRRIKAAEPSSSCYKADGLV